MLLTAMESGEGNCSCGKLCCESSCRYRALGVCYLQHKNPSCKRLLVSFQCWQSAGSGVVGAATTFLSALYNNIGLSAQQLASATGSSKCSAFVSRYQQSHLCRKHKAGYALRRVQARSGWLAAHRVAPSARARGWHPLQYHWPPCSHGHKRAAIVTPLPVALHRQSCLRKVATRGSEKLPEVAPPVP